MAKVDREVAQDCVDAWLEARRIKPKKREEKKESIEAIIDAVEDGVIMIDPDTNEITQMLDFPVQNSDGVVTVKELVYKPRLTVLERDKGIKGVKADDGFGLVHGYISAMTDTPKQVLKSLDMQDYNVCQNLATLFM